MPVLAAAAVSAPPLVIAHRGASGYRPEHTLASYRLAAELGADYLEPDVVATADGVLVARHENELSGTTDVATRREFADRLTTKVVDGTPVRGWFTEDFELAELKRLRARERLPRLRPASARFDGCFPVPTLDEVLQLRRDLSRELRREIGVYIETKRPTYFRSLGLALEEPLLAALERFGLSGPDAPVHLQSFELGNLCRLRTELGARVPLVLLAEEGAPYDLAAAGDPRSYADLLTASGLRELNAVLDGIGPARDLVIPRRADGTLGAETGLVADAHAAGLSVHVWTFRAENAYLPAGHRVGRAPAAHGRARDELLAFLAAGVDGVFTDHPDLAVAAREAFVLAR